MIEKTTRINFLFDFYRELLTPKQQNYMELYYVEDYSLGEIAELFQVSRQAVYDNIRRTESVLESYENKLRLYEKFENRSSIIEKIESVATDTDIKILLEQLKEID